MKTIYLLAEYHEQSTNKTGATVLKITPGMNIKILMDENPFFARAKFLTACESKKEAEEQQKRAEEFLKAHGRLMTPYELNEYITMKGE